ncbi:MAG: chemotaxis protein CheD [Vicinamibacteria bacterium]|nr:chemotaxis protein CheD [Vicinamibacteria bacterium]
MSIGVYLQPGQLVASGEPLVISTVLGSCVSVCLWDPHAKVGGMNHFLLPEGPEADASPRYAAPAIDALIAQVRGLGSRNGSLTARLFGGACVIEAFRRREGHLGQRNVEIARERLRAVGVPIVGEDVGGGRGRRLHFSLGDGTVTVRIL